jgi:hypothetical protein
MSEARSFLHCAVVAMAGLLIATVGSAAERPELTLDTSQADAVLAILQTRSTGSDVCDADWQSLFTSEAFQRLEKRELSMGRAFPREGFREFVLSDELLARREALAATLAAWRRVDLAAVAARIVPYLPAQARIRATVYPVIKPKSNSFVFETETEPAIFLYLDPEQSAEAFANTVAHELHHVGLASLSAAYRERLAALPDDARQAATWIGAFGEGLAVLAAAGSPEVHPMRDFPEADRIRWDQDQKGFDQLLAQLDAFFVDVVSGGFARPEVADRVAFGFFGYRGPWYTVGWRMGALVENRFGRTVLLECIADPRQLLARYNQAAKEANAAAGAVPLPRWSEELLAALADATPQESDRKLH